MNPFEVIKFAELEELPRKIPKKARPKRGANPQPKGKVIKAPAEGSGVIAGPRTANWKSPEYKYNPAMREALERARLAQPALTSMGNTPTGDNNE